MSFNHLASENITSVRDIISLLSVDLPACKSLESIEDDIRPLDSLDDDIVKLESASNVCGYKNISHHHWGKLSGRLKMLALVKSTPNSFINATIELENLLDEQYFQFCMNHHEKLESFIVNERDWVFDKFAMETLIRGYLLKFKGKTIERPSYLYLRVATYLYMDNKDLEKSFKNIKTCYDDLSRHLISHASPTQFNAGTKRSQLASCFLMSAEDNMQSIIKTWGDSAIISMNNGGIGLTYDSLRHSEIGHQGTSKGIVPMIKIQNEILSTIDQCFAPDTIVYTYFGPRKIKDINSGDNVLGKDGLYHEVFKPMHHSLKNTDKVYQLEVKQSMEPVIVTDKHPVYVINSPKGQGFDKIRSGSITPEFVEVENLTTDHLIGTPIPTYEKDIGNFDIDDCRMYGIMLGDGHISEYKSECGVTLNTDTKRDTIKFVKKYLMERNINIWTTKQSGKNTFQLRWSKGITFPVTRSMLYNEETRSKRIVDKMIHLPLDKIAGLFYGIMETDGTFRNSEGEIYLELTSRQVIESVRYILLRTKTICGGCVRDRIGETHELPGDRGSITTKQKTYELRIPKTKWVCDTLAMYSEVAHIPSKTLSFIVDRGMMWSRIIKPISLVEESNRPSVMIDLLMNRDNLKTSEEQEEIANYTTSIGLVHNGGRRPGSGTIYINDWHIDVFEFIDLKKPTGNEEYRARDLTYGLMISDEFMRRVKADEKWSLFCPAKTDHLEKTWGSEFEKKYRSYEASGKNGDLGIGYREVNARELFNHIVEAQLETGMPFMVFKDAVNRKNNQQNLGTIRLSNLCVEINEYTDENNIASCNLASIPLSPLVENKTFNFEKLGEITRRTVRNLAQVILRNYYPEDVPQIKYTNMKNRPIGIGVQDLAGCFALMDYSWESSKASELNEKIARVMYYHAMDENVKMAEEYGCYETFNGSPCSKGLFQFDMWNLEKIGKEQHGDPNYYYSSENRSLPELPLPCSEFDWEDLRTRMKRKGIYFSLLFAQMPTASTAQILGNNESVEPYTQVIYNRTVTSGCFTVCVKHFINDMEEIGLWNDDTLNHIMRNKGSIATLNEEGLDPAIRFRLRVIKKKYKTAYELSQKLLANLYMDRAKYQCQTTSNNLFMSNPTKNQVSAFHFHTWSSGAKTGMYYLKQTAKTDAINFSMDTIGVTNSRNASEECIACGA